MTPSDSGCDKKISNVLTLFTTVKLDNYIHTIRVASTSKILSQIVGGRIWQRTFSDHTA